MAMEGANILSNALQLVVSTALRLVEQPNETTRRTLQRKASDFSMEKNVPEITLDQVSWHDSYDDCWIVLYDRVYDVTEFLQEHPGGADVLMEYAGRDATLAYRGFGHSTQAWKLLQKYLVGILPEEERTTMFKEEKFLGQNHRLGAATS